MNNTSDKPIQYQKGFTKFYKQSLKNKFYKQSFKNSQDVPVQYQKGYCEFYKLKFLLTPDVLIPRPETELLVDEVLKTIQSLKPNIEEKDILILDIGTGSGNIAISVAKNTTAAKITATDISPEALKIAGKNAKFHGVTDRIKFIKSDLLKSIPFSHTESLLNRGAKSITNKILLHPIRKDQNDLQIGPIIIVTNLPYIPTERINYLDSSVKDYEPRVALDGGQDGFGLYRKLFSQINEMNLKPDLLIGEIDYTHGNIALDEAKEYFPEAFAEIKTDLTHRQRILLISF